MSNRNILLSLAVLMLLPFAASGQNTEGARKELEKRNIPWNEGEFVSRAQQGNSGVLELFLASGMNPDTKDSDGRSALAWAAVNGQTAAATALLNAGADVNTIDNVGMTPLMFAASSGKTDMIRLLLDKGANVNSKARDGRTALMLASAEGHAGIMNILIDRGAYINAVNREGKTSLILAASGGRNDAVKALLEKGADVDARDNGGLTALMWAESNRHSSVIRLLRKVSKEESYSAPSQTLTNPQLQRDVWNYILQLELALDEKCQDHIIVSTEITEYLSRVGASRWAERWIVERCGEKIYYRIEFRPDGKGGTFFNVSEDR